MLPNPEVLKCYEKNNISITDLKKIKIKYDINFKFTKKGSLYYYVPEIKFFDYIVCFDLDWTLTYSMKHLYPKDPDDIHILPNRRKVLENLIKNGYNIVIFTNQFAKSENEKKKKVERVSNFLRKIKLPIAVFIATEKDGYRKPEIKAFQEYINITGVKAIKLYFIGDAIGRPQDFDDSDKKFASNIKATLLSPEELFPPSTLPEFKTHNQVIIFVGPPGSGKTSFYKKYLCPYNGSLSSHLHVNQDQLKTKQKVLSTLKMFLSTGKSIVIDSTNPDRSEYYKIIPKSYSILVLHFVRDGYGWNKLRGEDKKVPDIVYHLYYKKFIPFTEDENVVKVWY